MDLLGRRGARSRYRRTARRAGRFGSARQLQSPSAGAGSLVGDAHPGPAVGPRIGAAAGPARVGTGTPVQDAGWRSPVLRPRGAPGLETDARTRASLAAMGLKAVLHDQTGRDGHRARDLPLDHRSPWREAVGDNNSPRGAVFLLSLPTAC